MAADYTLHAVNSLRAEFESFARMQEERHREIVFLVGKTSNMIEEMFANRCFNRRD